MSSDVTRFTGYLPDPEGMKFRDFDTTLREHFLAQVATTDQVDDEIHVPEPVAPFNQFQMGSCVLNAWLGLLEVLRGNEGLEAIHLSRLFLYWLCRMQMGTLLTDSGTYPYLAAERLENVGVVSESLWPYIEANLFTPPPTSLEVYKVADDNKFTATAKIYSVDQDRLDAIDTCLRANHPVVLATDVGKALFTAQPDDVLKPPSDVVGGHAMLITGRRKYFSGRRDYRLRNSYGPDYCDHGHVWVSEEYITWRRTGDLWTATRAPQLQF